MISHTYKFILITPQKTGSVSFTHTVIDCIDIRNIVEQRGDCFDYNDDFNQLSKHSGLSVYHNKWKHDEYGSFDDYKLYGSIRNPYDRVVSWWKWQNDRVKTDFKDFVYTHKPHHMHIMFRSGKYKISNYIRFESMREDFDYFCSDVGITKRELCHRNKSRHKHYTEYYDDETREIVAEKYAEDLQIFSYKY